MKKNLFSMAVSLLLLFQFSAFAITPPAVDPLFIHKSEQSAGFYDVLVYRDNQWQHAGVFRYGRHLRDQQLDLSPLLPTPGIVRIRLFQNGGGAAHIDTVMLGGRPAIEINGCDDPLALKKVTKKDSDVIDAYYKTLDLTFVSQSNNHILAMTARIEPEAISKIPFHFPKENLFKPITAGSQYYPYKLKPTKAPPAHKTTDASDNIFFKEHCITGSGHPAGYTYGWVGNDEKNLYVKLDFTPDNTRDGDKDYAKLYVRRNGSLKEFRVSELNSRWGHPEFTYTDKVAYQHKVYHFTVPLEAIGIAQPAAGENIDLAFAAYGTAYPAFDIDGDGVGNDVDNCPLDSNPDQTDLDQDGVGDVCELYSGCPPVPPPLPLEYGAASFWVTHSNVKFKDTGSGAILNDGKNFVTVNPGDTVSISFDWSAQWPYGTYCPGCVVQLYYGIRDWSSVCLVGNLFSNVAQTFSGTEDNPSFTVPTEPGFYYITAGATLQYSCQSGTAMLPEGANPIAFVVVGDPQLEDTDNDGLGNPCDNCPDDPNPGQDNLDGDAFGNLCDDDVDGDGILNDVDDDDDNDGLLDADEGSHNTNPFSPDSDGDWVDDGAEVNTYLTDPLDPYDYPETVRVSVGISGNGGNAGSILSSISADGRYVTFESSADNLVPGDNNGVDDVFVFDRQTGTVARISVDSNGNEGTGHSRRNSISADGRYVAFDSSADNLVSGDTNGVDDVFVHDRDTDENGIFDEPGHVSTTRISVDNNGNGGNASSSNPSISADGRYVAFDSWADNLVSGDNNDYRDVFVLERQTGTVARVSIDSNGNEGNGISTEPSVSADGRYVVFYSLADNLVPNDTNAAPDVFVVERQTGTVVRISVDSDGNEGNGSSFVPSISADGRYIAFHSSADNLVSGDTNGVADVFVHDRDTDQDGIFDEPGWISNTRVSVDSSGSQASGGPSEFSSISADGRCVAFDSRADNLVPGDDNGYHDVFVHDRDADQDGIFDEPGAISTILASVDNAGDQGNRESLLDGGQSISPDCRYVAFESEADNLVPYDTNARIDIFVRELRGADIDGDGLLDAWEQQIIEYDPADGINTVDHVNPGDDFDGDGVSNQIEYENGTNPTDPGNFTPAGTGVIRGTVVDSAFPPQAGVESVVVFADNDSTADFWSAETDANGNYIIVNLPLGCYHLNLSAAPLPTPGIEKEFYLATGEVRQMDDFVVISGNLTLEGKVTYDGNHLVGANVSAFSETLGIHHFSNTDSQGDYVIPNLPAGEYVVRVEHSLEDYAHYGQKINLAPDADPDPITNDISLAPEARVTGRVVDPDGLPVTNAWVEFDNDLYDIEVGLGVQGDGSFTIENLPEGIGSINVHADNRTGLCSTNDKLFYVNGGDNDIGKIALQRCALVEGYVTGDVPGDFCNMGVDSEGLSFSASSPIYEDGSYLIRVPEGTYKIYLDPESDNPY